MARDSHGHSMSFHVITRLGGSLVQIDTKFHDDSMSFIQIYLFSQQKHDMDFGQVQVMEFQWHLLRKRWDFPCGFGLILEPNQTAVKKT